jgi:DNA-binding XRE family transcriptional regulator
MFVMRMIDITDKQIDALVYELRPEEGTDRRRDRGGEDMTKEETYFDHYLARKLADDAFRARFEAADRAWDVALQLAALRQARGLTQKQVADLLGTRQQAIARLENPAYTGHSLSMVRRYVEALGASLDVTIIPAETLDEFEAHACPKPLLAAPA